MSWKLNYTNSALRTRLQDVWLQIATTRYTFFSCVICRSCSSLIQKPHSTMAVCYHCRVTDTTDNTNNAEMQRHKCVNTFLSSYFRRLWQNGNSASSPQRSKDKFRTVTLQPTVAHGTPPHSWCTQLLWVNSRFTRGCQMLLPEVFCYKSSQTRWTLQPSEVTRKSSPAERDRHRRSVQVRIFPSCQNCFFFNVETILRW